MKRIDWLLLGYREYVIEDNDVDIAIKILYDAGINVKFNKNKFIAPIYKIKQIEGLMAPRVKFKRTDLKGVGGFLYGGRKRIGIIFAFVICAFLALLSRDRVWDVRVEGSESGYDAQIIEELSNVGFGIGTRWSRVNKSEIEVDLLSSSECVSWININRRGTVAYVKVVDKVVKEEPEKKEGYSNVVAEKDGVIEEITVKKGFAKVRKGDVVKKGDILISGIMPEELGGGFVYAEGEVIARVSDRKEVFISENEDCKIYEKKKLTEINVKIFKKDIKILKLYRNCSTAYDIIEEKSTFNLRQGKGLPITVTRKYIVPFVSETKTLNKDEMIIKASDALRLSVLKRTANATVLKLKTDGGFVEGGYCMYSDILLLESIGTDISFEVE